MAEFQQYLADESATDRFGRRLAQATYREASQVIAEGAQQGCPTLGGVIHLRGDLGAGKTCLTRGILRGYGHSGAVKSPTYTLVEPYEFEKCHIYHFDLYRLADPEEVLYLGTEEYFNPANLCIVEWADRGGEIIPGPDIGIRIEQGGTGRELYCQSHSEKGEKIIERLQSWGRNP